MPSTVIQSYVYDAERQELRIVFQSGRVYRYFGVPPEIPIAMKESFSKGEYFNREIRGAYDFVEER
jgi:KTSC domain